MHSEVVEELKNFAFYRTVSKNTKLEFNAVLIMQHFSS